MRRRILFSILPTLIGLILGVTPTADLSSVQTAGLLPIIGRSNSDEPSSSTTTTIAQPITTTTTIAVAPPVTTTPPPPPPPESSWVTVESTAYCLTSRMANGEPAHRGAVAVVRGSPWFGKTIEVDGSPYGPGKFEAKDRIGHGSQLDFATSGDCATAKQWGRRTVRARMV